MTTTTNKGKVCLLHGPDGPPPGGNEHIFLAQLGGRLTTLQATCPECNRSFSELERAVIEEFEFILSALEVPGQRRRREPPTIRDVGEFPDGTAYDLAPGLKTTVARAKVPPKGALSRMGSVQVAARDMEDGQRVADILSRREGAVVQSVSKGTDVPLPGTVPLSFHGPRLWRVVAKGAVVAAARAYGNNRTRRYLAPELLMAIMTEGHQIERFCCWDYLNSRPTYKAEPLPGSKSVIMSGFEHRVVIGDVDGHLVAYLDLFDGFQFSVQLGIATGEKPIGYASDPVLQGTFQLKPTMPSKYVPFEEDHYRKHCQSAWSGVTRIFTRVIQHARPGCQIQEG